MSRWMSGLVFPLTVFFQFSLFTFPTSAQELQPDESKYERASLRVNGGPMDSTVTIHYSIADSAHVSLIVFDRSGEIVANPLYSACPPGSDSLVLNLRTFREGTYNVELELDHVRSHRFRTKGFKHYYEGRTVTYSQKENDLLNQAMSLQGPDPKTSFRLFDSLLTHFPNYLNRPVAFLNALGMYVKQTDSVSARAIVDSILVKARGTHSFNWIARVFAWYRFDLAFAQQCAESSISLSDDVPLPYRASYLFRDYHTLADVHIAAGNDALAERALEKALTIHKELPSWDRFVMYNVDVSVIKKLGPIKERKGELLTAMELYRKALAKEPEDAELWSLVQHAFVTLHNSEEGYSEFRNQLISTVSHQKNAITERDTLIGTRFPGFALQTLKDEKFRLNDFKGKVLVVNFWDFWCGKCLEERSDLEKLYKKYNSKSFAILGVHGRVGLFGHLQNDQAAIEKSMKKYPTSFPTVIETESSDVAAKLGGWAVPTSVVVDKKGVIRFREIGYEKYATLKHLSEIVEQLLVE